MEKEIKRMFGYCPVSTMRKKRQQKSKCLFAFGGRGLKIGRKETASNFMVAPNKCLK